jgi:hypothetical protein
MQLSYFHGKQDQFGKNYPFTGSGSTSQNLSFFPVENLTSRFFLAVAASPRPASGVEAFSIAAVSAGVCAMLLLNTADVCSSNDFPAITREDKVSRKYAG